jgi:hypothetical protein
MSSGWRRLMHRGSRRRRFTWAHGSARASPLLVCAMAGFVAWVPLGLQPGAGSAGSWDAAPPSGTATCLAQPSDDARATCFAAMGKPQASGVPAPVAACLGEPPGERRAVCFAAVGPRGGAIREAVARCLAKPAGRQRARCLRQAFR